MTITETLYVTTRAEWRAWLEQNHATAPEIWLVNPNQKSGRPRLAYSEAVQEALCFGWIDSTVKSIDSVTAAQRFTPRRKGSQLSMPNKFRIQALLEQGLMTEAGIQSVRRWLETDEKGRLQVSFGDFHLAPDIEDALRSNPEVWEHYQQFDEQYRRLRIAFIEEARSRPDFFRTRLNYFLKMTAKGKRYGMEL
jgi:uncharacterized protein YdeI (YjbR/CyaY-like superfamily)